jgi:hypothetical protein
MRNKFREYLDAPERNEVTSRGEQAIRAIDTLKKATQNVTSSLETFNRLITPRTKKENRQTDALDDAIASLKKEKGEIAEEIREAISEDFAAVIVAWNDAANKTETICKRFVREAADHIDKPSREQLNTMQKLLAGMHSVVDKGRDLAKAGADAVTGSVVPESKE